MYHHPRPKEAPKVVVLKQTQAWPSQMTGSQGLQGAGSYAPGDPLEDVDLLGQTAQASIR